MEKLNSLICHSFLSALAKLDSSIPPDIIPAINQVGQALAQRQTDAISDLEDGQALVQRQTDAISDLEDIVKQHPPLAERYEIEYNKLLEEYQEKELNKYLGQKNPDSPPPNLLENFVAPILMDVNPQDKAKNKQDKLKVLSD